MIPSKNWFPGPLQERAAWFDNFNTQFATVAVGVLGFTAATVTEVNNDNEAFQFLASNQVAIDAYREAVRHYRIVLTEGAIGEPNPDFPTNPTAVPTIDVDTGIFQRLVELVDRIRVAPNYTSEIGAVLGIIPKPSNGGANIPENELKPVIKAGLSYDSYRFDVNVTRLGQEAFKIQIQRNGSETWTDTAFATNNPCTVTVTPTTPNQPERILVRAILLQKNTPIGQPSDPTYVTVNP